MLKIEAYEEKSEKLLEATSWFSFLGSFLSLSFIS